MTPQKSLLTVIGEWFDQRQATRRTAPPNRPGTRLTGWLPTRGNVIFTLAMIALLVAAQTAGALPLARSQTAPTAASTGTIAYQGRLADAAGAPLTGTYNMIFRLYDAATGGTPLWSEQWTGSNGVRVSDGLFNVMLGSLAQLPISQLTNSQSLFLGITVGTDDEMAPRVQLGSVPFAVQALTVPDGSVTTEKIADGAVTQEKQTIATSHVEDNTEVRLQGQTNSMLVSQFQLGTVPAGDVIIIATLTATREAGASSHGSVWLIVNGVQLEVIPLHALDEQQIGQQLILHGRLPAFSGGPLVIQVMANSENPSVNILFGAANDGRFGRHVTIIAGL